VGSIGEGDAAVVVTGGIVAVTVGEAAGIRVAYICSVAVAMAEGNIGIVLVIGGVGVSNVARYGTSGAAGAAGASGVDGAAGISPVTAVGASA
jgi:hypothetical protein